MTVSIGVLLDVWDSLDPDGLLFVNMGGPSRGSGSHEFTLTGGRINLTHDLDFVLTALMPDHTIQHVRIRVPLLNGWKWFAFDILPSHEDSFRSCLGM